MRAASWTPTTPLSHSSAKRELRAHSSAIRPRSRPRVNAVDPGFTATDLNHRTGTQTVEQGADVIVRMALIDADGPTGTFRRAAGPLPW
ncbi:hypothetical protein JCM4814A_86200 [Streptomyces phaeofaciens JCM 4814]|uniref:Uncharacterized protein n=1 Tax=Streptomyces phaeofaciens TaxID=68254 RepID=A0A918H8P6_9ACTN|nr:hypothetical protein GCM10010226_21780 [Streptomyces phaeofaciens]